MATLDDFDNYIKKVPDLSLKEQDIRLLYQKFFADIQPVTKPKLIVLGGSPGAGKTTYRKAHLSVSNFHIHDLDEVQVILPGYLKDLNQHGPEVAFKNWWQKAQKIANAMVRFAFDNHYNVIYDRTCGTEESFLDIKKLFDGKLYRVCLYGFWVTEAVALSRVKQREQHEQRTVTPDITKEYGHRFSALWPLYTRIAHEIYLINNNGSNLDFPVIYQRKNGIEKIFLANHYQAFKSAGRLINFSEKFPRLSDLYKHSNYPNPNILVEAKASSSLSNEQTRNGSSISLITSKL